MSRCFSALLRYVLTGFVATALLSASLVAAPATQQQVGVGRSDQSLLWQVSRSGQLVGYLFGTMHSEDERVLAVAQPINAKVEQMKCLALEMELSQENSLTVAQAMFFDDGRRLSQVVKPEIFTQLVELLATDHGIDVTQADVMKPWAAMMVLSIPKPKTGIFLDLSLYLHAQQNRFAIFGLESAQEQIAVMDSMSLAEQVVLLESVLRDYQHMPEMFEKLAVAYMQQDLDAMETLYQEYTRGAEKQVVDKLTERLLVARNRHMAERLRDIYSKHQCVAAVGALHLPGELGVINKLREYGFDVQPMKLTF